MAIRSGWFLARALRGSLNPNVGHRRGFFPAVLEHLSQVQRPGQWVGFMPVEQVHAGVCVVAFDDSVVDPAEIVAEFRALRDAPDARVFHLGASFDDEAESWGRLAKFKAALEAVNLDSGRLDEGGRNVRHAFREATRQLLLYQRMGRNMPTLPLAATLGDVFPIFRSALHDRLLEMGFPQNKLGSPTDSLRAWYRELLADFGGELDDGRWHLARKDFNLKGPSQ